MDRTGKLLAGKYELRELVGKGGMATVWRAEQFGAAGFARPVGIKRIRPELATQQSFVKMFIEEARVCAQLAHPNIVQIYDFGADEGSYFLVMEWVEGLNLVRLIESYRQRRQLLPWPVAAVIAIESLRALSAAHSRLDDSGSPAPVIHRDVSPPNILIGTNGIVKLSDFGLARAMDRGRITEPEMIKGKIGYLAPELALGQQPTVDSDLYSLGVTLWEALTGRRLYHGKSKKERLYAMLNANVPQLCEIRSNLPPRLAAIVHQALARKPEERFPSAQHMAREITNLLRTIPVATDAGVIAQCINEARDVLGIRKPSRPPPPL